MSSTVWGSPLAMLSGPCHDESRASTLARATSPTCTKSRSWPPSSKTRGGSPASSALRKMLATPAYGLLAGHPRPVHVVVAERADRRPGLPAEGRWPGARCAASWRRRRCGDRRARPRARSPTPARAPHSRARRLEAAGVEVGAGAGPGSHHAVVGAPVPPLAVDDHRRGHDQPAAELGAPERPQQRGGAGVVVVDVALDVVEVDAEAHPGRLVADGVDTVDGVGHGLAVVEAPRPGGRRPGWRTRASPEWAAGSSESSTTTSSPRSTRSSTTWLPMKPEPTGHQDPHGRHLLRLTTATAGRRRGRGS